MQTNKAMTIKRAQNVSYGINNIIKNDNISQIENQWVRSDNIDEKCEQKIMSTQDKSAVPIKPNAKNLELDIRNCESNANAGKKFKETPSNTNTDIRSRIKKLKITSQIECVDNATSMQSDDMHFRTNRK